MSKMSNASVVIKALQAGIEVELEGGTYVWFEDKDYMGQTMDGLYLQTSKIICTPGDNLRWIPYHIHSDMTFHMFVEACGKLPNAYIMKLSSITPRKNVYRK